MYTSLEVIQVLNSEEELAAFPVEGAFRVSFNSKPDSYLLNEYAYLIRHDGEVFEETLNLGNRYVRTTGDTIVDRYDVVAANNSVIEDNGVWVLEMRPREALVPNASYYAILSKHLAPQHYTLEKVNSFGSSNVSVETETVGEGIDATFIIEITSQSVLSTGSHIVGFSVLKDGLMDRPSETLDIKIDKYELVPGILIAFNPDVPFLVGERFRIVCTAFTRLEYTKIQSITTFIDSDVIQPSDEIQSKRIEESDMLKFYEENGWASRVPEEDSSGNSLDGTTPLLYEYRYPDTIIIDCGAPVELTTLTDDIFNIDIDYAFGNYMLPNMGLSNDEQYTVTYSLSDPTHIKLVIAVSDGVPEGQRFVLVAATAQAATTARIGLVDIVN